MRGRTVATFVGLGLLLAIDGAAEMLPTLSLRDMAIEADLIVVAEPVDGGPGVLPSRYRVVEILKGGDIEKGQEVAVENGREYALGPPRWSEPRNDGRHLPSIQKALLFLAPKHELLVGRRPLCSGIRALSDKDELLVPQQQGSPGPMYLLPSKEGNWDAMLAEVGADLPRIDEILKLGAIADRAERNKAVLGWIEGHKGEFRHHAGREKGWHSLEPRLLEWVFESCIPEDCWRALELSLELEVRPQHRYPSFSSSRGRQILSARIGDETVPEALQLQALDYIGASCWPSARERHPGLAAVIPEEHQRIVAQILPLLDSASAGWRAAAVSAIAGVSWPRDAEREFPASRAALGKLEAMRGKETDPDVASRLADALRRHEWWWRDLSRKPHGMYGIVVRVRFPGVQGDRLGADLQSGAATMDLRLKGSDPREPEHLKGADAIFPTVASERAQGLEVDVSVSAGGLSPGTWRGVAEVTVGDKSWRSEPFEIEVREPAR